MKVFTTHLAALLIFSLAQSGRAQSEKEKVDFAKIAEEVGFAVTLAAYDNLVYVRIRLNSLPVSGEPSEDMQGNAVAAALARPFSETDASSQLWRVYFREAPALIAAAGKHSLSHVKKSYAELLQKKKPVRGALMESWLVDLRMIFTNSQAEALLNDPVRRNYVALLTYGAFLATVGETNEAKIQRAMLKGAVRAVHGKLSPAVLKPSEELSQRAGMLGEVLEAKAESWDGFLKWFESAAR